MSCGTTVVITLSIFLTIFIITTIVFATLFFTKDDATETENENKNAEMMSSDSRINSKEYNFGVAEAKDGNFYSIGDLLNMPYYCVENYICADRSLAQLKFPLTIFWFYQLLHRPQPPYLPNPVTIRQSVKDYHEFTPGAQERQNLIDQITDDNVLCIHMRSGDKGVVSTEYINHVKTVAQRFSKCYVFCGVHNDIRWATKESQLDNMTKSVDLLAAEIPHLSTLPASADDHVLLMYRCKNLILHLGGFSILGSLVFTGNHLYVTKEFQPRTSQRLLSALEPLGTQLEFLQ